MIREYYEVAFVVPGKGEWLSRLTDTTLRGVKAKGRKVRNNARKFNWYWPDKGILRFYHNTHTEELVGVDND